MKESKELQLSQDLNVITAEINSYKQVAGQAIFEIGRRLKHVKENDLVHGEWESYCTEQVKITPRHANRYIKVVEELGSNQTSVSDLGINALYEIATLPEEEREKEHVTSKGETKTVDEMTVRELQEVKRKLKQTEQQLKEEQSKEPKVVEKVVEIDNTDYEGINNLEKEKRQIEEKMNSIKLELEEIKLNNSEVSKLKEGLKKLNRTRDDLLSSIDVAKIVGEFSANTDNYIDGELSRIMRPDNFDEIISSKPLLEVTDRKVQALRLMVEEYDMKRNNYKLNSDIIDVEII